MSKPTPEERLAERELVSRRRRAQDAIRGIRRCVSQMQRPKCKEHIKVRRLRQIAAAIDNLGDLGFDDLGDGALINAIADAMKDEDKMSRRQAFHDIYGSIDLFERMVMGYEIDPEKLEAAIEDQGGVQREEE